jgi:predicted deacetylase
MKARYLVRFDDLCPTQNWDVWEQIEEVLLRTGIRPLLAVIPDNRDESLKVTAPRPDFWDRAREWQARGWTIGIHGYQHRYVTRDRGMFGWNGRSEFAGLSFAEQHEKIQNSLAIFEREGVVPEVWVAPNHSFDRTTVAALNDAGLRVISDGLALYPYVDKDGMVWIPLQLWGFRPRRVGVWTVCLHPNKWANRELEGFSRAVALHAGRITDFDTVRERFGSRPPNVLDRSFRIQRKTRKAMRTWFGQRNGSA